MELTRNNEARLRENAYVLVSLAAETNDREPIPNFHGSTLLERDMESRSTNFADKTVYLQGKISRATRFQPELKKARRVFIIQDLSSNYDQIPWNWNLTDQGHVPRRIHGLGVLYPRLFHASEDYFNQIRAEHAFQSLTESTKPGKARRTGIYLTPVTREGEDLRFHLLRCSTNLSGPSENFRDADRRLVTAVNEEADFLFENAAPMNHVLAQIYHNTPATETSKETKARINSHSDKTKDMPENGIMAFCTFYDGLDKLQPLAGDPFDLGRKGRSGLTRLQFRLKPDAEQPGSSLPSRFSVPLYPGSVFFMPLSTNRLYTHAVQSSTLNAEMLPTRLGYVVRCSSTEAIHSRGRTFLKHGDALIPMEPPSPEGMARLRELYARENKTADFIDYGDRFLFSMNRGDYDAPRL